MKVTVIGRERHILNYSSPVSLYDVCRDAGEAIYAPCGGVSKCGKCRVSVVMGDVSEPTAEEITVLGGDAVLRGERLACRTVVRGDTVVRVHTVAPKIMTDVSIASIGIECVCEDTSLAVDIGTTTVAAALVTNGRVSATVSLINPQTVYGADVISRISYAKENGVDELHLAVRACVDGLAKKLGAPEGTSRTIVGNTVMLHLYEELDPSSIGRAPFTPLSLFGSERDGEYIGACVSGYIGSDVISAAIASGMTGSNKSALLCDIGTNGEILYWDGERLNAVSAAAGPALEGAGISCGMIAEEGAVDSVKIENGKLNLHVIGGGEPRGLCGGGLIDAVACLYELGVIDSSGYMEAPYDLGGVLLMPADVRAFQLAKGAIRAAIEVLTEGRDIDTVYISGGFGTGLSVRSAIITGLIPKSFSGRVKFIGNGALSGAVMMLTSADVKAAAEKLAAEASFCELSSTPEFAEKFIGYLDFPDIE